MNKKTSVKKQKAPPVKKPVMVEQRFVLRYPIVWLILIILLVYIRTLTLSFTKLDDSIFIIENKTFNEQPGNIAASFHRGLFNPAKDAYYRPIFLVDFIIESKFFGTSPAGYHFTNILFHVISVILLFLVLKKVGIPGLHAWLLAMIFAVHPVLSQAVAWIPGRNDMLLMIFFLAGLLLSIKYTEKPGILPFLGAFACSVVALFTKETAVIIPFIISGILVFILKVHWKKVLPVILGWVIAVGIWILVRSTAPIELKNSSFPEMIQTLFTRLPAIVQYLGKIILPVNLSVFPVAEDTANLWGILALVLIAGIIVYSRSWSKPLTWFGIAWFLAFLLPVLIVPKELNDQLFEHRLYLPLAGILLVLSQTILFSDRWKEKNIVLVSGVVIILFSVMSFSRIGYYKDSLTFWSTAVEDSPHSAYAKMMLGTKVTENAEREKLFREALALDPKQKNLNFYLGKVLFEEKKVDSAEKYIRREPPVSRSQEAWFLLAQFSFKKNQFDSAAVYLEKVIELDPLHEQANNNLARLYIEMKKIDKAILVVDAMKLKGMPVPPDVSDRLR